MKSMAFTRRSIRSISFNPVSEVAYSLRPAWLVDCGSVISCLLKNQQVKEEVKKYVSDHKRGTRAFCLLPMQNMLTFHCGAATHHMRSIHSRNALYRVSGPHGNRTTESSMSDMFMSASLQISHESRTLSIAGSPPERRPELKYQLSHGCGPVAGSLSLALSLSVCHTHTNTLTHSRLVSGLMQSTLRASNC